MEASQAQQPQSLQQKVQAARRKRQDNAVVRVAIPGYKGLLVGRYKTVDWRTRVDLQLALEGKEGRQSDLLWELAADHLLSSCEGIEASDGGETQDLGLVYGRELGEWLGLDMDDVETPRQAIGLIIEDGEDLIDHFGMVRKAQSDSSEGIDRAIVGESEAVS